MYATLRKASEMIRAIILSFPCVSGTTGKAASIPLVACLCLLLAILLPAGSARGEADHHAVTQPAETAQATCPVMTGKKIDPNIFTIYQGKKVFFCCAMCKGTFQEDPEKYMGRLPQFGGTEVGSGGEHAEHNHGGFSTAALIRPMGIATLSLVAITVCLGLFRRKNPKLLLKWHKRLGPTALLAGAIHAVLVMLAH